MSETPKHDGGHGLGLGHESVPLMLSRPRPSRAPTPVPPLARPAAPPGGAREALRPRTRLGAIGLLFVALLVFIAAFAEMLASDLPIMCKLHGELFVLPNVTRPAELASMSATELAREAEWSITPLVAHGPRLPEATPRPLRGPGALAGHPLGTDHDGRDVFARLVHGTRSYLVFALVAVLASLVFGGFLGGVAGLLGGPVDALVGRAIETVSAFPPLVLILGIQAAVPRPTLATLFLAIALTRWPEIARLVRAEVMLLATRDYVMAARALGASPLRILRRHVMPHVRGQLIVLGAVGVPAVVLVEASLDFLRIGPPVRSASWGEMLSEFRDAPHAWWLLAFPGALLFATVIALNLVGEARREALDPRAR